MERGKLKVEYIGSCDKIMVDIELANNTVWLAQCEITDIFNVATSSITKEIKRLKKQEPHFCDANILELHIPNSKQIQVLYNLDIIFVLAFRINGGYCKHIRHWICKEMGQRLSRNNGAMTIFPDYTNSQILN